MSKGRLEAFSDGVIAILITIMVLELKVPHGATVDVLRPLAPVLLSYVLSFVYLGTYWNNHHHLLQASRVVDGRVLWANLHLLFWLSLFPFVTGWMGENEFAPIPTAAYGAVFFAAAVAYYLLVRALIAAPGQPDSLRIAVGQDTKGRISLVAYVLAIPIALVAPIGALVLFVAVLAYWFIPDRRMERALDTDRPAARER
jgi:TMEM175 potassium channel family protein